MKTDIPILKLFISFLRLYRADAFLITTIGYLGPIYFINDKIEVVNWWQAFYISGFAINFIYSYNSIYDSDIDRINKPSRPIPNGDLSSRAALIYAYILLFLSLFLPPVVFCQPMAIACCYLFSIIGILYSHPFFRFKTIKVAAVILTSIMLALPLLLAVIELNEFKQYAHFATFIFFYCLFIVPLKDIEDEKGDVEHGAQSWSAAFGSKKLVKISLSLIILLAVIFCVLQHTAQGINNLLFMAVTTAMTQLIFLSFRINLNKLYKTLIIQNIIAGLLFVSWVNFF